MLGRFGFVHHRFVAAVRLNRRVSCCSVVCLATVNVRIVCANHVVDATEYSGCVGGELRDRSSRLRPPRQPHGGCISLSALLLDSHFYWA